MILGFQLPTKFKNSKCSHFELISVIFDQIWPISTYFDPPEPNILRNMVKMHSLDKTIIIYTC